MRKASVIALCLAVGVCGVSADEPSRKSWILGLSEIPASVLSSLGPADQASLASLPALVLKRVRDLGQRIVPEEEERSRIDSDRLKSLYSGGAEAAGLRDKRDSAALSPSQAQKRAADERSLESAYEKKSGEAGISTDAVPAVPDAAVPIELWSGHDSGKFIAASPDPAYTCVQEKLDYLIRWEITEIDGYFRISLDGWNEALRRSDFYHTTYCPRGDVSVAADELAYAVLEAASARPSAYIVFQVEPADAEVFVDGRRLAPGRNSLRVYEERELRISAEAKGYGSEEATILPSLGKTREVVLKLKPRFETETTIGTNPYGAALYLDGIWSGTTPLAIPLPGRPRVALFQLPGYEDLFEVIDPAKGEEFFFTLEEKEEAASTVFARRKEKFYNALGFLVVSLPVSIVTYGLYNQNALLSLENPGVTEYARRRDVSFGCFAAAAGISGALFVNAAARLVRYVRSAR